MIEQLTIPAIEQAGAHADKLWVKTATSVLEQLALTRAQFTSDDVWNLLEPFALDTHEHRAMGAILREASRRGLISKSRITAPSTRATRNGGDVRVWISNVYPGGTA